ncbi:hypothetical protein D3C72_1868420 [compost metagenome]
MGLGEFGLVQQVGGNDALRQVVEALEAPAPGHRHLAGGEQPLQRMLFRAPVPPGPGPLGAGAQGARAEGTLLAHGLQHPLDHLALLETETRQLLVDPLAIGGPAHAPAQQRIEFQRQQRSLVAPVLE